MVKITIILNCLTCHRHYNSKKHKPGTPLWFNQHKKYTNIFIPKFVIIENITVNVECYTCNKVAKTTESRRDL